MATGSTLSVLVVEDETIIRAWIVQCLEEEGCSVLEAASGDTAVTYLRDGHTIDVVFTDIRLGNGPDGWDVAEEARKARPEIRVVYTSANVAAPRRDVAGSIFIAKPYDPSAVLKACRKDPR
jgi:CheY-like chemotaxis protein